MLGNITSAVRSTKIAKGFGHVRTRTVTSILGAAANVVLISMSTLGEFTCVTSVNMKLILSTLMIITSVSAGQRPRAAQHVQE